MEIFGTGNITSTPTCFPIDLRTKKFLKDLNLTIFAT